jgi:selenocysteine lyase/cysteine desulfurase
MPPTARLGDRSLFPELRARAYLNHAAISPPSSAVVSAVQAVLDDYARLGVGALRTWLPQRRRLKERLGALVSVSPDDVAIVPSTTAGVIAVALCFPWRRGDRIVLFDGEFPANVTPWQRAAELHGLEIVWLSLEPFARSHEEGLAALGAELGGRGARLVAVSAVQFRSGLRMPIDAMSALCRAHGAELFVDAIQACGALPFDARSADYVAAGAHKWLMGLEGIGFLCIRPERAAALRPVVAGWLSHLDPLDFLLRGPGLLRYDRPIRPTADMVEPGSQNVAGCAALEASVTLLLELGVGAIAGHVGRYLDRLEPEVVLRGFRSLRSAEPAARSGILSLLPPSGLDVVALVRELEKRGVAASIPDGVLRFAPHWPNALDEVEDVLAALDASVAAVR